MMRRKTVKFFTPCLSFDFIPVSALRPQLLGDFFFLICLLDNPIGFVLKLFWVIDYMKKLFITFKVNRGEKKKHYFPRGICRVIKLFKCQRWFFLLQKDKKILLLFSLKVRTCIFAFFTTFLLFQAFFFTWNSFFSFKILPICGSRHLTFSIRSSLVITIGVSTAWPGKHGLLGGSWQVCQLSNSAFACCSSLLAAGLAAGTLPILFFGRGDAKLYRWHHGCWWEWKLCYRGVHRPQLPCVCKIEPWVNSSFLDWRLACGE